MRRHEHVSLTCDYDMRENDARVPNKLKGREQTWNVQRHEQNRSNTATNGSDSFCVQHPFLFTLYDGANEIISVRCKKDQVGDLPSFWKRRLTTRLGQSPGTAMAIEL